MTKYKASVSFAGAVTASVGSEIEINDEAVVDDLKKAGYIEPVKTEKKTTSKTKVNK